MKLRLYTIYDKVAEEFGPIVELKNDKVALRWYSMNVQKDELNASDFECYCIGECNHDTGVIIPREKEIIEAKLSLVEEVEDAR